MKREDLRRRLAGQVGITLKEADEVLSAVIDAIRLGVAGDDGRVCIKGLGTFLAKDMKSRTVRNPGTGETYEAPAHRKVGFRASEILNRALNEGAPS